MEAYQIIEILNNIRNNVDEIETEGVSTQLYNYLEDILYQVDEIENNFMVCEDCGYIMTSEEAIVLNNGYYCEDCASRVINEMIIKDWHSHKGKFKFKDAGETNPQYYRGFELEVEIEGDKIDLYPTLEEWEGEYYFENDSSLNNGFEIISQPMSLQYWRQRGINKIEELIYDLQLEDVITSWESGRCGLHVHFNKKEWDKDTQRQLIRFICHNHEYFKMLSGREDFEYCKPPKLIRYDLENIRNGDRYLMLNFTNNTIEFRLFRGTLNIDSIKNSINLCEYILRYCEDSIKKGDCATPREFEEWLLKTTTKGEELIEFIEERKTLYKKGYNNTDEI